MFNHFILASAGTAGVGMLIYLVIIGLVFYFILIRPQRKEQKRMRMMLSEMQVGDCVVTSGGFYGVLIDIADDTVIVEFGNNKNCRIPMQKSSIVQVEKAEENVPQEEEKDTKKDNK